MDEKLAEIITFAMVLVAITIPFMIVVWGTLGFTFRPPWRHRDDCLCSPCIDKAFQREVGHMERKRRIQEIRNAMADLERERRDR